MTALLVGLPFLGALLGFASGRRTPTLARLFAILPVAAALVLAVVTAWQVCGAPVRTDSVRLTPTGALDINLSLYADGQAALASILVTGVALLVQVYSTAYLRDDPRYSSYAALVSLFSAAMLLVVFTGDLIVLLVGWEVMGVCSYFLIGHHWETEAARSASLKAFVVTKLGDVPFLIGILVVGTAVGSFDIQTIVTSVPTMDGTWITVAALLLLCGVVGKSAQLPLQVWLPDAMAGPTPVSALIHAATMVAAGVYFTARLYPVFAASEAATTALAVIASVTMLGAALAALAQEDLKRVLAWSTVSQLAYMTGGLAVGGPGAATFHMLTHGAFKALLFLAAGVAIHAAGTGALAAMGGRGLRLKAPVTFWTMTLGLAALAGLPPFAGFFSKEAVLGAAEHQATDGSANGWLVLVAGLLTVAVTAAYATRLWLRAFFGPPAETEGTDVPAHADAASLGSVSEAPSAMRWPLIVLAVPTVLLGFVFTRIPDWLGAEEDLKPKLVTSVLSTALILAGAAATWLAWRRDPAARLLGPLQGPALRGFDMDRLYAATVVKPVYAAAGLSRFLDREVVDTYVRGAAQGSWLLGGLLRRTQNGNVRIYLTGLFAGVVILTVAVLV